jgi:hypothetical protein
MNELTNAQREANKNDVMAIDHVMNAHNFLVAFLAKFELAKRGGIHDFMEIAMFNMINQAIKQMDLYLTSGHKSVSANELMSIFAESCQTILDNIKRNLEKMGAVNLQ